MRNTSKERKNNKTQRFQAFLNDSAYYTADEAPEAFRRLIPENIPISTNKSGVKYLEIAAGFDIETSSFYNPNKTACVYLWSLIFAPYFVIVGRTLEEFARVCNELITRLNLSPKKRAAVYVHNLAFEFQFIRGWFEWADVFAVEARTPLYALTVGGLEFRCSYLLSNRNLAAVGRELRTYSAGKMSGAIDYNLVRLPSTALDPVEVQYNIEDVKVVVAYIQEFLDRGETLRSIPRTSTGFVRRAVRDACLKSPRAQRYRDMIRGLTITPEEYKQLKRAFQGGFTHCNPFYSGITLENVLSYDFTSSYPAVMIAEQYPMSRAESVVIHSHDEFERNLRYYCCLFDITFYGLQDVFLYDNYLSESRCWGIKGATVNNGRIVSAAELSTTVTEQDFLIIRNFYKWEHINIYNFKRYKKGYLPREIIGEVLQYYQNKTILKGIAGKEYEYAQAKALLNSIYGMMVTDLSRVKYQYKRNKWTSEEPGTLSTVQSYNNSRARFLFYPWGVWVTAYARRNLFTGIYACKADYIYSDTDSIKITRPNDEYFKKYNTQIQIKIRNTLKYYQFDTESAAPVTQEGTKKPLGVWDFEGVYCRFKSLGAKRYLTEAPQGVLNLTIAGVNKRLGAEYLARNFGILGAFKAFSHRLTFPPEATGKLTHTYIDEYMTGAAKDYRGKQGNYYEVSGVHLEPAEYTLSIAQVYYNFLLSLAMERNQA